MEEYKQQLKNLETFQSVKKELSTKYQKIESAFEAIDVNGSGSIQFDDFKNELSNNHSIDDESLIQAVFDVINTSKSGKITLEEFETLWTQVDREISSLQKKIDFNQAKPQISLDLNPIKNVQILVKEEMSINQEEFDNNPRTEYSTISPARVQFEYHSMFPFPQQQSKYQESKLRITPAKQNKKNSYLTTNVLSPNKAIQPQQQPTFLKNNNNQQPAKNSGNQNSKALNMKKSFDSHLSLIGLGKQAQQQRKSTEYGSSNLSNNISLFTQKFKASPILNDVSQSLIYRPKGSLSGRNTSGPVLQKSLSRSPERFVLENFALQHYMNKLNSQRSSLVQSLKSINRDKSSDLYARQTRRSIF